MNQKLFVMASVEKVRKRKIVNVLELEFQKDGDSLAAYYSKYYYTFNNANWLYYTLNKLNKHNQSLSLLPHEIE